MDDVGNEDSQTETDRRFEAGAQRLHTIVERAEVDRSIERTDRRLRSITKQHVRLSQSLAQLEQTIETRRGKAHPTDEIGPSA